MVLKRDLFLGNTLLIAAKRNEAVAGDVMGHPVLRTPGSSLGQEAATSEHNNVPSCFLLTAAS